MLRTIGLLIFIAAAALHSFGQGAANSLKGTPVKERIVTGGGFGLGFSSTRDFVSLSPALGYMLTTRVMAGTSVTYRFTNYKFFTPSMKLQDYAVNPFLRFTFYRNIVFLQTEYEYLNYEFPVNATETIREDFGSYLGGIGAMQPIGKKLGLYVMALYNFSYKTPIQGDYSPYNSPWVIRAGVNYGNFSF